MKKIFSNVDNNKLLHIVFNKTDFQDGRQDIIPENNFLQCSSLKLNLGKTFKPHKHIWKDRCYSVIAQESWVCIQGRVKCFFYDIDDTLLTTEILNVGDASFTLEGGHNYEILSEDTIVYEFKTGPYEGQKLDKTFL
jgi:hypothetical protein